MLSGCSCDDSWPGSWHRIVRASLESLAETVSNASDHRAEGWTRRGRRVKCSAGWKSGPVRPSRQTAHCCWVVSKCVSPQPRIGDKREMPIRYREGTVYQVSHGRHGKCLGTETVPGEGRHFSTCDQTGVRSREVSSRPAAHNLCRRGEQAHGGRKRTMRAMGFARGMMAQQ